MYAQYTEKSGKNEVDYFQSLYSERMDTRHPSQPRLRYAILAQARTGSELVSAYLRRQGIGLPLEYFHDASIAMLAARWGCLDAAGAVDIARYRVELERREEERDLLVDRHALPDHKAGLESKVRTGNPGLTQWNPDRRVVGDGHGLDSALHLADQHQLGTEALRILRGSNTGRWARAQIFRGPDDGITLVVFRGNRACRILIELLDPGLASEPEHWRVR